MIVLLNFLPIRETRETAPSEAPQSKIKPYSCGAQQIELTEEEEEGKSIMVITKRNLRFCFRIVRVH